MANEKKRRAASKGGKASHGRGRSRNRSSEPMSEIGRKGAEESQGGNR